MGNIFPVTVADFGSQQAVQTAAGTGRGKVGAIEQPFAAKTLADLLIGVGHTHITGFQIHIGIPLQQRVDQPGAGPDADVAQNHGQLGKFLQKTMSLYDQIWVLDTRTEKVLKEYPALKDKVFVTPNSIHVDEGIKIQPSNYKHIAFVGNLIPNKGLYELVEAVVKNSSQEVRLSIVGKGDENVITKIKAIAGNKLNKRVHLLGLLSNEEAVAFMKMVDIVALPTYYPWEAFPISILEAMSLGKLVISTPRAAIKDMLTALDGTDCGILVREKSVEDIVQAIEWCNIHKDEADELCRKAYEKVYTAYRMEVVYSLYRQLYRKL